MDMNVLRNVENNIALDSPFGDWRSIINRTMTFYDRGLQILSKNSTIVGEYAHALSTLNDENRYHFLGHPVIRSAINTALEQLNQDPDTPPNELETILNEAQLQFAPQAQPDILARYSMRIGEKPYHAEVWTGHKGESIIGQHFCQLFQQELANNVSSKPAVLRMPDMKMRDTLIRAAQLLDDLMPTLSKSILPHVHLIAVVDVSDHRLKKENGSTDLCQNVSTHSIPGTIFLSPSPLRSVWHAAEALLHEGAHKKLSDLVLTRSIFRSGYSTNQSPTIRAIWNRSLSWNSNDWPIDRALFALHVYVHLALFFSLAHELANDLEPAYGSFPGGSYIKSRIDAIRRAQYLALKIRHMQTQELGRDGAELLVWLQKILDAIDQNPNDYDPSVDLLLDRYDNETKLICRLIRRIRVGIDNGSADPSAPYEDWSATRIANHLIHSEINSSYRILSILGEADPPTFPFYNGDRWSAEAATALTPDELVNVFAASRKFNSSVLRNALPPAFKRVCYTSRSKTLYDIVEDMVEHATRHVDFLFARLRTQQPLT